MICKMLILVSPQHTCNALFPTECANTSHTLTSEHSRVRQRPLTTLITSKLAPREMETATGRCRCICREMNPSIPPTHHHTLMHLSKYYRHAYCHNCYYLDNQDAQGDSPEQVLVIIQPLLHLFKATLQETNTYTILTFLINL